jgi:hypothetical protein
MWYLFDAQWQDPFRSAPILALYLTGQNKPIYHPMSMLFLDASHALNIGEYPFFKIF